MNQRSYSELEFDTKKRKTRREQFLEKLEVMKPWQTLEAPIARYYVKAGSQGGRPAVDDAASAPHAAGVRPQ